MRRVRLNITLALIVWAGPVIAEVLVAARTLPGGTVLTAADIGKSDSHVPGALTQADEAIGLETRLHLYAGRPILADNLGPPTLVDRNAIVMMIYHQGGLTIRMEGRVLGRGGIGDRVRVMNLASRTIVSGWVTEAGEIAVHPPSERTAERQP
jgi:flagella basal body P-ring formation protein FlgA